MLWAAMIIDQASQQHPLALGQVPCGAAGGWICWGRYSCGYVQQHPAVPWADGLGGAAWEILRLTGRQPFSASFALAKRLQLWGGKGVRSQPPGAQILWQPPVPAPLGSGAVAGREFWGWIPAHSPEPGVEG